MDQKIKNWEWGVDVSVNRGGTRPSQAPTPPGDAKSRGCTLQEVFCG